VDFEIPRQYISRAFRVPSLLPSSPSLFLFLSLFFFSSALRRDDAILMAQLFRLGFLGESGRIGSFPLAFLSPELITRARAEMAMLFPDKRLGTGFRGPAITA